MNANPINDVAIATPTETNYLFNYTDRAVKSSGGTIDAAHNFFAWCQWLLGNTTGIDVKRWNQAGVLTGNWRLTPEDPQMKIDNVTGFLNGPNINFIPCGHLAISDPNRPNPTWLIVLPGVAVAFNEGVNPMSGTFNTDVLAPTEPGPNPNPTPSFTVSDIMTAFKQEMGGELGQIFDRLNTNTLRRALQREVNDENGYLGLLLPARLSNFLYTNDGLAKRLKESVWLQLWKSGIETGSVQVFANLLRRPIVVPQPVVDAIHEEDPSFTSPIRPQ